MHDTPKPGSRASAEARPSFTLLLDAEGVIRHVDRGFATLVDRPRDDLVGSHVGFVLRPDPTLLARVAARESERTSAQAIRSDGEAIPVTLSRVRVDLEGGPVCALTIELAGDVVRTRTSRVAETPVLGIAIVDAEGVVLECNATFRSIVGASAVFHPRSLAFPELGRAAPAESDGKSVISVPLVRPDGSPRRLAVWSERVVGDASARRISVLDETDRRDSVRALVESDRRFRATFEQSAVGLAHVALDGTFVRVNDSACRLFGYQRRELVRMRFNDLVLPEEREASREAARELSVGVRDEHAIDRQYVCKDGALVWVHVTTTCVRDERGRPDYFFSVIQDISARKRAEVDREGATSLLRATLEATVDGIVATDLDERFVGCNAAFLRMWNIEVRPDRDAGRILHAPSIVGAQLHREAYVVSLDDLYAHPEVDGFDALELNDGRVIERHSRPQRVLDTTIGRVFSFRDVTDRVRAEAGLKRIREQTIEAQKMEAVGRLAGGIAHDFNNLLTVISSYCQLLERKKLTGEKADDAIREVLRASDRAAALTNQLLAYGRKQMLEPVAISLNDALEGSKNAFARLVGPDIALDYDLGTDDPVISADPSQLDQVVMNLVVNARDAMPNGGRLRCTTSSERLGASRALDLGDLEPGDYGKLTISDDGCGMSDEVRSRVFEPFFTTKDPGKGTGLGLATVFGVVRQSGGAIEIDTAEGRGTTVSVYLPASDATPASHTSIRPDTIRMGTETILVVEDSESVRRLTRAVLESYGYAVIDADSAGSALALLDGTSSRTIHAIVTDVIMPGMNGRDFATLVRSRMPTMPVLLLSGFNDAIAATEADRLGGHPFLAKPFTPDALARRVRILLDS